MKIQIDREKAADQGSALVMVLIMVIVLSLAMASVAMLSATASTTLRNSSEDAGARSEVVVDALAKALNYLSYSDLGDSRRYGLASNDCGPVSPLVSDKGAGYLATYSGVDVYCKAHVSSGQNTAVASLILTGTCTSSCTIGTSYGLSAQISGGGIPKGSCGDSSSVRLKFSAGILNVSGQWDSASCASLEFGAKGKITQPGSATCPDNGTGTGSWWMGDAASSSATYAKCVSDNKDIAAADISPSADGSALKSFISSIDDQIVPAQGTPTMEVANGGCAVLVRNGSLSAADITKATNLLSCTRGTPVVFFANADTGSMGRVLLDSVNLSLSSALSKVVFGQPNADYTDCNTSLPGTQLQVKGSSVISLGNYTLSMCDPKGGQPSIAAPAVGDASAPFTSNVAGDFLTTGTSGSAFVRGYVFAPGGSASLKVNSGKIKFDSGAMFRAFTFFASASPDDFGNIPQPPELSGDRLVQLRFKQGSRDLGMVQVIIRDYYGRRRAIGIGIKSWRTLW